MQPTSYRILELDALRGLALLGILIVNLFVFHAPYAHYHEFYSQFEGFESDVLFNVNFFLGGQFMPIFAFLFGYGFWLQFEKTKEKIDFNHYWYRRMLVLIGFGVFHVAFFSFGDILIPYALLGLLLPLLAKKQTKTIILLFLLAQLFQLVVFVMNNRYGIKLTDVSSSYSLEESIDINKNGSFFDIMWFRLQDYFSLYNEKVFHYIPKEWSLMLAGIIAARSHLVQILTWKKGFFFCFIALSLALFWYFKAPQIFEFFNQEEALWSSFVVGVFLYFSVFCHHFLYIVGFLLLWKSKVLSWLLQPLCYIGKMSLTNYIMQSAICALLFSGYGLSYYATFKPSELIILGMNIYFIQVLFSYWWLKKHEFGPLEWVWRRYSYKKA